MWINYIQNHQITYSYYWPVIDVQKCIEKYQNGKSAYSSHNNIEQGSIYRVVYDLRFECIVNIIASDLQRKWLQNDVNIASIPIPIDLPIYKSAIAVIWKIDRMLQTSRKIVEPRTFDGHLPCIQLGNLLWWNLSNVIEILLQLIIENVFDDCGLFIAIMLLTKIHGRVWSIHVLVYGLSSKSNITIIVWHNCLCCLPKINRTIHWIRLKRPEGCVLTLQFFLLLQRP